MHTHTNYNTTIEEKMDCTQPTSIDIKALHHPGPWRKKKKCSPQTKHINKDKSKETACLCVTP